MRERENEREKTKQRKNVGAKGEGENTIEDLRILQCLLVARASAIGLISSIPRWISTLFFLKERDRREKERQEKNQPINNALTNPRYGAVKEGSAHV